MGIHAHSMQSWVWKQLEAGQSGTLATGPDWREACEAIRRWGKRHGKRYRCRYRVGLDGPVLEAKLKQTRQELREVKQRLARVLSARDKT